LAEKIAASRFVAPYPKERIDYQERARSAIATKDGKE
jgi:hypothetical protein